MKPASILVVEDDNWLSEQYSRVLSNAGYLVHRASNALSAIEEIDDINPDAIILDVLLTGSTAFALLHELQSYGDTGGIAEAARLLLNRAGRHPDRLGPGDPRSA